MSVSVETLSGNNECLEELKAGLGGNITLCVCVCAVIRCQ